MSYYGTLSDANSYFSQRLHSEAWGAASASDKESALTEATQLIDSLNYRGVKHSVWLIMYDQTSPYDKLGSCDAPTRDEVRTADSQQDLEFPRGQDTDAPNTIKWACYEIALALIEGFDPEDAAASIGVIRQAYSAVRTTYADDRLSQEYLVYGIPTAQAWRWLKPYLTDSRIIRNSRAN